MQNGAIGGTGSSSTGTGSTFSGTGRDCLPCLRIEPSVRRTRGRAGGESEGFGMEDEEVDGGAEGEEMEDRGEATQEDRGLEDNTMEEEAEICSCGSRRTLPYLLRSRASVVKLTFMWLPTKDSGLNLVYSFQKRGECIEIY